MANDMAKIVDNESNTSRYFPLRFTTHLLSIIILHCERESCLHKLWNRHACRQARTSMCGRVDSDCSV